MKPLPAQQAIDSGRLRLLCPSGALQPVVVRRDRPDHLCHPSGSEIQALRELLQRVERQEPVVQRSSPRPGVIPVQWIGR